MQKEKIYSLSHLTFSTPPQPDLSLQICGTTYPNKNYVISRPHSRIGCIEFVVHGKGHVEIDGQKFSPVAGDTYFLPAGKSHHYYSDRTDPWEKIWVNVSGDMVEQLASLYRVRDTHYFPALDTSDLLLKLQYYATHQGTEHITEKCASILHSLFYRMSESLYAKKEPLSSPLRKMLDYIALHETDTVRIEQLAAACERSPSQAERIFRSEMGMPPYRYVLSRKLELAKQLLRDTGMPIRDIASYLSFEDEFYFSGLFRRKVGVSPSKYRQGED